MTTARRSLKIFDRVPTFHQTSNAYVLPNDKSEHDRLTTQHEAIMALTQGRLPHAPITSPKLIVEVGCGTGAVTRVLAEKYPGAEVIGVDLSAVPFHPSNASFSNLKFVQGDFRELAKTEKRFGASGSGQVDFLFSRLLVCGITDWPGYIKDVYRALRPGGWVEMQEIQQKWRFDDPTRDMAMSTDSSDFLYKIRRGAWKIGLDPDCIFNIEKYMRRELYEDIVRYDIRCEFDEEKFMSPGEPSRSFVDMFVEDKGGLFWHMLPPMLKALGEDSPEELQRVREQMLNSTRLEKPTTPPAGKHIFFTVTVAKKPGSSGRGSSGPRI